MAPSRGLCSHQYRAILFRYDRSLPIFYRHERLIHTSRHLQSGHNRWSKIKHDKGKNDAVKNRQRAIFSHEIATASKMFGPDVNSNPRLADLITKAKREGFAKTSIEAAIARGQGRSTTGSALETVVIEAILPNNVGVVMECETDNKMRTLQEVRNVVKLNGGSSTPAAYLFEKRGRIAFENDGEAVDSDATLDAAVEAGALDIDDTDDGQIVVYSTPEDTTKVATAISKALKLQISSAGVVYTSKPETQISLPSDASASALTAFLDALDDKECDVQTVAMNVGQGNASDDSWRDLAARLD